MFRRGYLTLGRWQGASIKLHWSIPVASVVFSGFQFLPGHVLGFTLLVLLHEFGHALVVRAFRLAVVSIEVTGLGGLCRWSGNASPFEESVIAWGGVLAQLVGWGVAKLALVWFGRFDSQIAWELFFVFTTTNLRLIVLNLMPIEPLDGARAWTIFSAWKDRAPEGLPHGTWRDHSKNAQRDWYDRARRASEARRPKTPPPSAPEPSREDGSLSDAGQRAIDALVKHAIGKVTTEREGDEE